MTTQNVAATVALDIDALAALVAAKLVSPPTTGGGQVTTPPPVQTGSPGDVFVGKLLWNGDWDYGAVSNYADTAPDGSPCMSFTTTAPWGGWLPYILADLDTTKYSWLTFDIWSTVTQNLQTNVESANDTQDGVAVQYAGGIVGQWYTKAIGLSNFKLTNPNILKFSVQDQTGKIGVKTYLRNVRFV